MPLKRTDLQWIPCFGIDDIIDLNDTKPTEMMVNKRMAKMALSLACDMNLLILGSLCPRVICLYICY